MKADLEIIEAVLRKHSIDTTDIDKIRADIVREVEDNKTPREKAPKKDFVIILSDPNGSIPKDVEFTGWVVQIDPTKGIKEVPDLIKKAVMSFNDTPKGQKMKLESIGDLFENATGKAFSENGLMRKHRDPAYVILTDNQVPKDEEPAQDN